MLVLSVSVNLLVILCALYFLHKIKDQQPGPLVKWSAYLVLWVAMVLLLFQLARGGSKLWHRKMCSNTECESNAHQHSKKSHFRKHKEIHGFYEEEMNGEGMEDCCNRKIMKERKRIKDDDSVFRESSVDTVDGKIIRKETEIIERRE